MGNCGLCCFHLVCLLFLPLLHTTPSFVPRGWRIGREKKLYFSTLFERFNQRFSHSIIIDIHRVVVFTRLVENCHQNNHHTKESRILERRPLSGSWFGRLGSLRVARLAQFGDEPAELGEDSFCTGTERNCQTGGLPVFSTTNSLAQT